MEKQKIESVYKCYPFDTLTRWGWIKLWFTADVPYFFMKLWWKITKQYGF